MRRAILSILLSLWAGTAIAEDCTPLGWGWFLNPGPQSYEVVERLELDADRYMIGVTFGPLEGDYAKVHFFAEIKGDCWLRVVSAGSYAGSVGEVGSRFHLDLYEPTRHSTLGFQDAKPSYEELRATAREVFE